MQFNSTIICSTKVHHFVYYYCEPKRHCRVRRSARPARPGACAVVGGGACTGREHENWSNT